MPKISVFTSTYASILPGWETQEAATEDCFSIYIECILAVNRQHNCLSDDCNREDLYGYKYAFLASAHQLYVNLIVSAKVSCLMKKLKYHQRHWTQINISTCKNSHIIQDIIAKPILKIELDLRKLFKNALLANVHGLIECKGEGEHRKQSLPIP